MRWCSAYLEDGKEPGRLKVRVHETKELDWQAETRL